MFPGGIYGEETGTVTKRKQKIEGIQLTNSCVSARDGVSSSGT